MDRFEGVFRASAWIAKVILVLCLSSISICLVEAAAQVDGKYCGLKELEVEQSHVNSPLSFQKIHFESSADTSRAWFDFVNSGQRPLDNVLVLIEFRRHDEYLFTMAFLGITDDRKDAYVPSLNLSPQFGSSGLPATVLPHGRATLTGYSPIVTFSCPDTARVTLMETGFDGHRDFSYNATGWRFDAFLDKAPLLLLKDAPPNLPLSMSARLSVDSAGHPTILSVGGARIDVATWLGRQIESWRFGPAIYDGTPITSMQTIVCRFHPSAAKHAEEVSVGPDSGVVVFVDIGLPILESTRNRVLYGGAPVTVVDPIRPPERK